MRYIFKKIITLIITLLIVSILAFLAFEIIPGDPALSSLGTEATPEKVEAMREEMGLNDPLPIRYGTWVKNLILGDMGISYSYQMPVKKVIGEKLPITFALTGITFILIIMFAIPLGLICVRYKGKWLDKVIVISNQVLMSIPSFFVGMMFTVVFGLTLKWFRPGRFVPLEESLIGFIGYLIFPAIAIAIPKAAMTLKFFRSALLAELEQDYVRTAYSRGNSVWQVLIKHVLRNGMLPVITFLGWTIADIIANSIIIEQVFEIPGLGRILISGISNRDYPVVEGIILLLATTILVVNMVVDLLYQKLDKQIEIEKR